MSDETKPTEPKSLLKVIVQPFIDLIHAPRALWGINLSYLIEGMVYFGMLGYLVMYFNDYVGLDDVWAGRMVGCLTAGITIAMFFLGGLADRWGVRTALLLAFCFMLLGRSVLSAAPGLGLGSGSITSALNLVACLGMLFVVIGYGMYQPAAYAAVRQFTTAKTSGMAYAMLYALMNLGGWLPTWAFLLRNDEYLGLGISGTFWVYTGCTILALSVTYIILTKKTVADAIASAKAQREVEEKAKEQTVVEKDD